jgi:23S rRNA (cytosine1962-C5)-methyltransferase
MTAYAVKASSVTLFQAVDEMMSAHQGRTLAGELVLQEKSAGRYLSTAIYARWAAKFKA